MANWSFQGLKFHTHPLDTDITYIDLFPGSWIKKHVWYILMSVFAHFCRLLYGLVAVYATCLASRVETTWRGWPLSATPRLEKKNEESNSPLTPVSRSFARSHAGVCLHEANRGAESHQPDVRRINAIIARSASRFIDRWLHHFAAFNRPFDCFSVSLLILAFWFFVSVLRILPFFLFVVVLPFLLAILYLCIIS